MGAQKKCTSHLWLGKNRPSTLTPFWYNVSPFSRDVEVRRSDVAMSPFIFLLKNNGQSILFISILGVD